MRSPRRRPAAAVLLATAVLLIAAVPPRPAAVSGDLADPDGSVRVSPALGHVQVAAGGGTLVEIRLANGTDAPVGVELSAHDVTLGSDGEPHPAETTSGPATWVTFADRAVTLPPGGVVDLGAAVNVPGEAALPAVVAVRGGLADGTEVVAFLALDRHGGSPSLSAQVHTERDARNGELITTITNGGDAAAFAMLRTQARAWYGRRLVDVTSGPVLVPAGARRVVRATFRAPGVPGPYTVNAVVRVDDTVLRASARGVLWNPTASLTLLAVALLGLATTAWLRARRSGLASAGTRPGDSERPASAADESPEA